MLLGRNHNDAFEFMKVAYKILLVWFLVGTQCEYLIVLQWKCRVRSVCFGTGTLLVHLCRQAAKLFLFTYVYVHVADYARMQRTSCLAVKAKDWCKVKERLFCVLLFELKSHSVFVWTIIKIY